MSSVVGFKTCFDGQSMPHQLVSQLQTLSWWKWPTLDGGQRKTTSSICLRNSRFCMTQALKLKFTAKQTTLLLLLCSALAHSLASLHTHCAHILVVSSFISKTTHVWNVYYSGKAWRQDSDLITPPQICLQRDTVEWWAKDPQVDAGMVVDMEAMLLQDSSGTDRPRERGEICAA